MTSEIGTIRPAAGTFAASTSASTAPGRVAKETETRQSADAVREAEAAQESPEPLEDVVSNLNKLVRELHRELKFAVDEDSGDMVVKVIDRDTEEVVRQIPSEEVLALRKRLEEAAGVFFRDSA